MLNLQQQTREIPQKIQLYTITQNRQNALFQKKKKYQSGQSQLLEVGETFISQEQWEERKEGAERERERERERATVWEEDFSLHTGSSLL